MPDFTTNWMDFDKFIGKYEKVAVEEHPNTCLPSIPTPLVSVVVITYEHKAYINNAIDSVLKQKTDFPFEVILGDDESKDGTREICNRYAKAYSSQIRFFLHRRENNIKIINQPCGIFQIVYNILKCRGQYIALLSGDDEWLSDFKLQKQVEFLETHPGVSMTYLPHDVRLAENGMTIKSGNSAQYPKASSALYRNVFQRLPEEMLFTISEDEILKGIAMQHGTVEIAPDAGKILVNITGKNLYQRNDQLDRRSHIVNTARILYLLFGKRDHRFRRSYARIMTREGVSSVDDLFRKDVSADIRLRLYYFLYRLKKWFCYWSAD